MWTLYKSQVWSNCEGVNLLPVLLSYDVYNNIPICHNNLSKIDMQGITSIQLAFEFFIGLLV